MKKTIGFATMLVALCVSSVFTSCSKDDDEEESINLTGLEIKVQGNGTFTFSGNITANAKITTFELQDSIGKQVTNLLEKNSQIKDKGEDGKTFTLPVESDPIDLNQKLFIVLKTKGDKKVRQQLTDSYDFEIGNASSSKGSYLSFVNAEVDTLDKAKLNPKEIDAVVDTDFQLMTNGRGYQLDKAKVYISKNNVTSGWVVSDNKLIASYEVYGINGNDAKIKGFIISETGKHAISGLTVNYSAVESFMSKEKPADK